MEFPWSLVVILFLMACGFSWGYGIAKAGKGWVWRILFGFIGAVLWRVVGLLLKPVIDTWTDGFLSGGPDWLGDLVGCLVPAIVVIPSGLAISWLVYLASGRRASPKRGDMESQVSLSASEAAPQTPETGNHKSDREPDLTTTDSPVQDSNRSGAESAVETPKVVSSPAASGSDRFHDPLESQEPLVNMDGEQAPRDDSPGANGIEEPMVADSALQPGVTAEDSVVAEVAPQSGVTEQPEAADIAPQADVDEEPEALDIAPMADFHEVPAVAGIDPGPGGPPLMQRPQVVTAPRFNVAQLGFADGRGRWLAGVIGVGVGLCVAICLFVLLPRESVLGRMFDLKRAEAIIPISISCIFVWGLVYCLFRFRNIKRLREACSLNLLVRVRDLLSAGGAATALQQMQDPSTAASPMLRRLRAILEQWVGTESLQDVNVILEQHLDHDEAGIHQNYTLVRLFIWALPVLGLIGTVIGISLAVGGFAHFLGGGIDDVGEIKRNLVSVTSGLSFAFLITLEGLATSLILMFCASPLQTTENRLFAKVQQAIVDQFLPALQQTKSGVADAASATEDDGRLQVWREQLAESGQAVLEAAQVASERTLAAFEIRQQEQRQHADDWLTECSEHLRQAAGQFSDALDQTSAGVGQIVGAMTAESKALCDDLALQRDQFMTVLHDDRLALVAAQAGVATTIGEQTGAVIENAAALREIADLTRAATESQASLAATLHLLQDSMLNSEVGQLTESLVTQAQHLAAIAGKIDTMARGTDALLGAHQSLHDATRQLHDTGLTQTLSSVRDSLDSILPALVALGEPFVLQAVPVDETEE